MTYDHIQRSPLWIILLAAPEAMLCAVFLFPDRWAGAAVGAVIALPLVFLAFCFQHLRVRDEGDWLSVRFGPIGLFGRRIRYSEITTVEAGRSTFFDGWGVHWTCGRGWIYNLWGFGCVVVHLGSKTVRVGTDDVDGLVRFLESRIQPSASA